MTAPRWRLRFALSTTSSVKAYRFEALRTITSAGTHSLFDLLSAASRWGILASRCIMPESSTLSYVADLVVRRVLADSERATDLAAALEEAYPFDHSPSARRIWLEALLRNAIIPGAKELSTKASAA